MTTTNKEELMNSIVDYFKENEELFNSCIEELDSYNGYLGDDRYYSMDEFNELHHGVDPMTIAMRIHFGGGFNPMDEYFRYNAYGNLESADEKDYSAFLDHYAVEDMAEHRSDIYSIDDDAELSELFGKLEEAEEA